MLELVHHKKRKAINSNLGDVSWMFNSSCSFKSGLKIEESVVQIYYQFK